MPAMSRRKISLCLVLLLAVAGLAGCAGYEIKNLAKSDVDQVADEFIDETRHLVRDLMVKLYKRNPSELRKAPGATIESRLAQLESRPAELHFVELGGRQEIDALELVFNPYFDGDRVFALIVGLGGMLRHAYGYNPELFMFDSLDSERLATSAQNTEILLWRLKNTRQDDGSPFLITSEYQGVTDNLSFERLFGKIIALQEMMARIAGAAGDRTVTKAVHRATAAFIPLAI